MTYAIFLAGLVGKIERWVTKPPSHLEAKKSGRNQPPKAKLLLLLQQLEKNICRHRLAIEIALNRIAPQ